MIMQNDFGTWANFRGGKSTSPRSGSGAEIEAGPGSPETAPERARDRSPESRPGRRMDPAGVELRRAPASSGDDGDDGEAQP